MEEDIKNWEKAAAVLDTVLAKQCDQIGLSLRQRPSHALLIDEARKVLADARAAGGCGSPGCRGDCIGRRGPHYALICVAARQFPLPDDIMTGLIAFMKDRVDEYLDGLS